MNRNIVFLSPHFPPNWQSFCRALRGTGANVLGVADEHYHNLPDELKYTLTDYYRVDSLENYDELVRALGYFTHRYGKIDRVESHNEHWLETDAMLRKDFNLYGIQPENINIVKRKSHMKEVFRKAGIKVAEGRIANTFEDAKKLIEELGYPVVAKPDKGVGAKGTYRIDNEQDLKSWSDTKEDKDYIIEEFIEGPIYTYDGLTDRKGKPLFITSHTYSKNVMEIVHEQCHMYYYSFREIDEDIKEAGRKCLEAFDIRERFFHFEFFNVKKVNPNAPDKIVALEINARPPGGFTTDMFNYSSDIDVYKVWAEMLVHGETKLNYNRKYYSCFISRRSKYDYAYSEEDIEHKYSSMIASKKIMPAVFAVAMGNMGYIIRSESLVKLIEACNYIHAVK